MKIYTKQGDTGDTRRPGGQKVRKSDAICDALGNIDELNAAIGWCLQAAAARAKMGTGNFSANSNDAEKYPVPIFSVQATMGQAPDDAISKSLTPVQSELLVIGAAIAAAGTAALPKLALDESSILRMEREIDAATDQMPPLTHFIIPGGTELSCRLHLARTLCRRAERSLVTAIDAGLTTSPTVEKYVNRLSDLLFTLARLANFQAGQAERTWTTNE